MHELSGLMLLHGALEKSGNSPQKYKIIYDAHEFETERNPPRPKLERLRISLIEKRLVSLFDAELITVSALIAKALSGIHKKNVHVIRNHPTEIELARSKNSRILASDNCELLPTEIKSHFKCKFPVGVIVGKVTINRGKEEVISLLPKLKFNLALMGPEAPMMYQNCSELAQKLGVGHRLKIYGPIENHLLVRKLKI